MQNTKRSLIKLSILLVSVVTASAPAINANIPVLAKAFPMSLWLKLNFSQPFHLYSC